MFIIQLCTLQEFLAEVPAPADVRLAQHYITRHASGPGATRDLCLDLMARRGDEIIWLHEHLSLQMTPGQDTPWTENGQAVQAAFPGLVELVRAALTAQGTSKPGGMAFRQIFTRSTGNSRARGGTKRRKRLWR